MRYIDTSVLLAFLLPEAGSSAAETLMTSNGDPLVVSSWSEVELVSALGVKIRSRQIAEREAISALGAYARLVSPCLRRIQVVDADHRKAVELLKGWRTSLRAGDSLHLAIAAAHRATIFTFDQGMVRAGAALGVAVRLLEFK
jgi:predicted nucleic acid-binding protein